MVIGWPFWSLRNSLSRRKLEPVRVYSKGKLKGTSLGSVRTSMLTFIADRLSDVVFTVDHDMCTSVQMSCVLLTCCPDQITHPIARQNSSSG